MEKFAQRRELSEKPLWLDVRVHDYSFLASERPIRGFPATVMRRRRRVAFSDFGQDLLCLSDPPCCPERPSVTVLVRDVDRKNLSRGLALSSQRGSKVEFSVLVRR